MSDDSSRSRRSVDSAHAGGVQGDQPSQSRSGGMRVFLCTGTDEGVMRVTADMLVACGRGGAGTVISYGIRPDGDAGVCVLRTVTRADDPWSLTPAEPVRVPMDGCCLTCTVKRDVVHVLESLKPSDSLGGADKPGCAGTPGSAGDVIVVLPEGMQAAPVARYCEESFALAESLDVRVSARLASVVNVVQTEGFLGRLFDERWFDAGAEGDRQDDSRCVGQVVADLLAEADHVLMLPIGGTAGGAAVDGAGDAGASSGRRQVCMEHSAAVIESLVALGARIHRQLDTVTPDDLEGRACEWGVRGPAPVDTAGQGADGLSDRTGAHDALSVAELAPGVRAMSVRSLRPVHPGRLSDFLQAQAAPMHLRGHFTVPNKPFSAFTWEADPRGSEIAAVNNGAVNNSVVDNSAVNNSAVREVHADNICGGDTYVGDACAGDTYGEGARPTEGGLSRPDVSAPSPATELMIVASCDDRERQWPSLYQDICNLLLTDEEMKRPAASWLDQHDAFSDWMALEQSSAEH